MRNDDSRWTTEEAVEFLGYAVGGAAQWRRSKAIEYPDDSRNVDAAECLERLEACLASANPRLLAAYWALYWGAGCNPVTGGKLHDIESDALRDVGFNSFPADANELLQDLIEAAEGLLFADFPATPH